MAKPAWTVLYNIVSPENSRWVGTGWEFFDTESDAEACRARHTALGDTPTKRPFRWNDALYLGVVDQEEVRQTQAEEVLGPGTKAWLDHHLGCGRCSAATRLAKFTSGSRDRIAAACCEVGRPLFQAFTAANDRREPT